MVRRRLRESVKKRVAASQRWCCSECGHVLESTYQIDHVVPHSVGGSDDPSNLTALCVRCHALKSQEEYHTIREFKRAMRCLSVTERMCWFCGCVYSCYFAHACARASRM